MTVEEVADALEHHSGLLGVSRLSADVAELERAAADGDESAALSLAIYVRRAASGIASAATSLKHLHALVFTGGIGEHADIVRTAICERLELLRVGPPQANTGDEDEVISEPGAGARVIRIHAREDVVIARQTAELLRADASRTTSI
jgi:acetate kinase